MRKRIGVLWVYIFATELKVKGYVFCFFMKMKRQWRDRCFPIVVATIGGKSLCWSRVALRKTRILYKYEWALSPEGVARGWQCSRGVDYHVGNPTEMSYLFYYTEHPSPSPRHPISMTSWNLQNPLRQCNVGAAGLPCWPCWDVIFAYHTEQPIISTGLRFYFFP